MKHILMFTLFLRVFWTGVCGPSVFNSSPCELSGIVVVSASDGFLAVRMDDGKMAMVKYTHVTNSKWENI